MATALHPVSPRDEKQNNGNGFTSMDTENLIINDDRECQVIKHVGKNLPHLCRMILPHALGVKAITLRDATRLVVPSHEMHAIRIPQL